MTQQLCVTGKADRVYPRQPDNHGGKEPAYSTAQGLLLPDVWFPRLARADFFPIVIGCGNGFRKSGNDEFEERANTG